jgi:hypothetical protein
MAIVEAYFHYSLLLHSVVSVFAVLQFSLPLSSCVSFVTDCILACLQLIPSDTLCIVLSHGAGAISSPGDSFHFRKTLKKCSDSTASRETANHPDLAAKVASKPSLQDSSRNFDSQLTPMSHATKGLCLSRCFHMRLDLSDGALDKRLPSCRREGKQNQQG